MTKAAAFSSRNWRGQADLSLGAPLRAWRRPSGCGALAIYREQKNRSFQPTTLIDLGETLQLTGDFDAALDCVTQALEQLRDLGNRFGETWALNVLGELACRTGDPCQARGHHAAALAIARETAVPAEEARALEGLGQACLPDGNTDEVITYLRQALGIYERIGSPDAERVQAQLREMQAGLLR